MNPRGEGGNSGGSLAARLARAVVAAAAVLARPTLRSAWREEWMGELEHSARSGTASGARLVLRALGSVPDALSTRVLPATYDRTRVATPPATRVLDGFARDVRYALRSLRRNPSYALLAAATLALGIGANTAIFSVVRGVLLEPVQFPQPDRLVRVWSYHPGIGRTTASAPDFADWRDQSRSFSQMAAVTQENVTLRSGAPGSEPERVLMARVTRGWFEMLGVSPVLGRWPSDVEDAPGAPPVAVLAYSLWQSRFGGDAGVVGRAIELDGVAVPVIGVAPPDIFPRSSGILSPAGFDLAQLHRRADFLSVFGRLRPEIPAARAEQELETIAARLERDFPATNALRTVQVQPFHDYLVARARPALYALLGAVAFVLLIGCANVANLTLARSARRQGELALRSALGAGGGRLMRQILVESLAVAALGGAAGIALGVGLLRAMLALGPNLPRVDNVRLDGGVLLFTLGLTLATALVCGLLPALRARAVAPERWLRQSGGASGRVRGAPGRGRGMLAGSQVALALALSVGAGLMLRSFVQLRQEEVGFRVQGIATARVALASSEHPQDEQVLSFWELLLERLEAAPEVAAAAAASAVPLGDGADYLGFDIEGRPPARDGEVRDAEVRTVTGAFFEVAGIPLLRGRAFGAADRIGAPGVAVINEAMVGQYWPDADPIGARITFQGLDTGPFLEVIGVVGDVRHELQETPYPQVWTAAAQQPQRTMTVLLTPKGPGGRIEAEALHGVMRREVAAIDPSLAVFGESSFEKIVAESLAQPRFGTVLLVSFAVVALLLSAVGLYGVLTMTVTERGREIGLRMALGATRRSVLGDVAGRAALVVGIGAAAGLLIALGLARLLRGLWYDVGPADPLALAAGLATLLLVAAAAALLPARRATRVDPMKMLRED